MNRRTSGASLLLYAGPGPARWFRTAATIVDAWGSGLCARQWHGSRAVIGQPVLAHPSMGQPLTGQLAKTRTRPR
jgi:hypothetical protein